MKTYCLILHLRNLLKNHLIYVEMDGLCDDLGAYLK